MKMVCFCEKVHFRFIYTPTFCIGFMQLTRFCRVPRR
jgi:hypothetical protein